MSFSPVALLDELKRLPVPQRYCIAYSGGCDSQALLHAMCSLREELPVSALHAIHIDHGLQADSAKWADTCRAQCAVWGISIDVITLDIQRTRGHSLEAQAREARYAALAEAMAPGDMLLLAQHEDDQAETLLLQLLRGSGVKGLAGMPVRAEFGPGSLARPLLGFARTELEAYAKAEGLTWIEDPSNRDTAYDRNFLRHAVLPVLRQRWLAASTALARAAHHQGDAGDLLDALAAQDYATLRTDVPDSIAIPALQQLDVARQRNVLRYWLQQVCGLPLPSTAQLARILDEVVPAAQDASPLVHWHGAEVRRYQTCLYAMAPLPDIDDAWEVRWDCHGRLELPDGGYLQAAAGQRGLAPDAVKAGVTVRFRRGGEVCRLPGRAHHSDLKKLLQDWGVPPWQRDRIPLVVINGQLAQIAGYSLCEPFCAAAGETALQITLAPAQSRAGH